MGTKAKRLCASCSNLHKPVGILNVNGTRNHFSGRCIVTMATINGLRTALVIWIKAVAVVSVEKVHLLLDVAHLAIWSRNCENR